MKRKKTIELFTFKNKRVCIFNRRTKVGVLLPDNLAKKFDDISYTEQFKTAKHHGIIEDESPFFLEQKSLTIKPKIISKKFEILREIFYKILLFLTVILIMHLIYLEYIHRYIKHEDFTFLKQEKLYWIIICLLLTVITSVFLHEMFHTYVARKNDAFVPEIGFQIIKRIPINIFKIQIPIIIFFTTIIGKEFMTKKQQIEYLSAGMMMNCLLASVSYLIFIYNYNNMIRIFSFLFFVINVFMVLSNMIPLDYSDGGKILYLVNNNSSVKEKIRMLLSSVKNNKGMLKILNVCRVFILFSTIVVPLIIFLLFILYLVL
ncbi:hypothetical protein NE686_19790 [Tissierella carlieri]|uniref:Uncharacterized protein n=1 Tax=Tissierella carlieri TaxID=689904 RepID=A0ABT1SFT4_9FIRM|nr:hypothetical protein [Tissierella carlieri]MCQ4925356.1 hypothetical protein [Tissierella carlieri]